MKNYFILPFILVLFGCPPSKPESDAIKSNTPEPLAEPTALKPKNVILMIGDGMGISQITAGMYKNGNKLNLEKFKTLGLHKSHAYNDLITDSAAAATAFACGVKTYNGAIGVDIDTLPVKSILEEADDKGLATGMVATSTIVHATPASFVSHQRLRSMYENIAADFLNVELDYFVGGGKKYFDRRESDDRNLIEELKDKGYFISDYFTAPFDMVTPYIKKNFGYFTADDSPLSVAQGRGYLMAASKVGMRFLRKHSDKGFFMMIEGSQIDWGGHANNSDYIISEMIDFDRTIGAVLDFAEKNGETLVIVTADHETGGYSIVQGSRMDSLATKFTTNYHTADLIPVFAYGPKAELFGGVYENTAIYSKIREAFGF